jgi:hypothetical protein
VKKHRRRTLLLLCVLITVLISNLTFPADTAFASTRGTPDLPAIVGVASGRADVAKSAVASGARASSTGVVFELEGEAPAGVTEAILWYDTEAGRQGRRFRVAAGQPLDHSVAVSLIAEQYRVSMPFSGRLDYWWALQGPEGVVKRLAGSVLLPPELRTRAQPIAPSIDADFAWAEAASEHFRFRYYPGTAAERDIERIKVEAEEALVKASAYISPTEPVSITTYLVPRVFWQGGAAYDGSTLLISYTDRNYTGISLSLYLLHESVHALAHGLVAEGGDVGGLIGEGIAVHSTGGHYGDEPIDAWTMVLRDSDRFVPLCRLRATFFEQQHEIAYLQGASFVGYLIRAYGLPAFRTFYGEEPGVPERARSDADTWCAEEAERVVAGIGKTYGELEREWLAYLDTVEPTEAEAAGFWGQIRFFDLMRAYQQAHDPDARILPPSPERWRPELIRAFATPAVSATNSVFESLLIAADHALDVGDVVTANTLMDELDVALETGIFSGTLSREHAAINSVLQRFARAQRLGQTTTHNITSVPQAIALSDTLWSDYRLAINSIKVDDTRAVARVERTSRLLGADVRKEGLMIVLERRPLSWRIVSIVPDPERPPVESYTPLRPLRGHVIG